MGNLNDEASQKSNFTSSGLQQLVQAVNELIKSGLMLSELSVTDDLLLQIESNLNNPQVDQRIKLEPLAEILTSLTIPQLTALGKLATKSIRKVNLEDVNCIDVSQNPFYNLAKELEASVGSQTNESELPSILRDLLKSCKSISKKFSG